MRLKQDEVATIVRRVVDYNMKTSLVAATFGVSRRRVQQLVKEYKDTGKIPVLQKRGRKPHSRYPPDIKTQVIEAKKKLRVGTVAVAKYLRKRREIRISNEHVHDILVEENMATRDPGKKGRRKPWVRYEREHPLSAVHIDWHYRPDGVKVCAIIDDCSRMILAIGEFPNISTDHAIDLLSGAMKKYSHIRDIREVITDHGPEFYANKRDKNGGANHKFENFLKENGIKHILCQVKHPQTNGKIEKFFDTYERNRYEFDTLEDFKHWYNCIRPHMSLDFDNLETPEQAFYARLTDVLVGNFMLMVEREINGNVGVKS